jgi:hypothetical protein
MPPFFQVKHRETAIKQGKIKWLVRKYNLSFLLSPQSDDRTWCNLDVPGTVQSGWIRNISIAIISGRA